MFAEFHDIGKLINWFALGLQKRDAKERLEKEPHEFEKCKGPEWGIDFKAVPWEIIFRKDQQVRTKYWKGSPVWLWVTFGDHLAAGWGRTINEDELLGDRQHGSYCLWTGSQTHDNRLKSEKELREMISFLNQSPSWESAIEKYRNEFKQRSEIDRPGMNVSTLLSHSIVAGHLARVVSSLKEHPFNANGFWKKDNEELATQVKILLAQYQINFSQRPFRVSDWNIFNQRKTSIREAQKAYPDNIIAIVDNECIGVFADEDQMKNFENEILRYGFCLVKKQTSMPLPSDEKLPGIPYHLHEAKDSMSVYNSDIPEIISLPICEVCQMAQADTNHCRWPAHKLAERTDISPISKQLLNDTPWRKLSVEDFPETDRSILGPFLDEPEEELCATCFNLRKKATPLSKLHSWGEGTVVWIQSHLDIGKLIETLAELHKNYIRESQKKHNPKYNQNKVEYLIKNLQISFPLLVDFFEDYNSKFLPKLKSLFIEEFSDENVESVDNNLWCVRIEKRSDAIEILRLYDENIRHCFPKLLKIDISKLSCPIRFSLSISPFKYPFFVHLRFLDDNKEDISIQLVNSGKAIIKFHHLDEILNALPNVVRSKIHGLASISKTSESLAQIVLKEKEREHPPEILSPLVPDKIDFKSLLTLTNLMED